MKVTRDKTEKSQAYLTVEMEPAELEESRERAYKTLVKKVRIPGFRTGKAPRSVLERHVGKEAMLDEAIKDMVPRAYEKVIAGEKIEPVAQPEIEVTQTEPVIFKAVVSLPPTIELGDYKSIRLTPEPVEVSGDDIDSVLERLRHEHAVWQPVERPVAYSDLVTLDVESTIDEKPYVKRLGMQYQVLREATFPAPGFSDHLVEMKAGEEKEFKLQFPADYQREELAGKEASFKVKISEIKEEKLPELNEDFAKQVKADFQDVDALREEVRKTLQKNADDKSRMEFEQKVVDAAVEQSKIEYPPVFVETEIDRMVREELRRWQMTDDRLEDYLKLIHKTNEQLREELRPVANRTVSGSLVLDKVAEAEKIEVNDAEVDSEIQRMTGGIGESKEKLTELLNNPRSRQSLKQSLIRRKTLDLLSRLAKGEDTAAEKAAEPDKKEE